MGDKRWEIKDGRDKKQRQGNTRKIRDNMSEIKQRQTDI